MSNIKYLSKKYDLNLDSFASAKQDYYTFCNTVNNPDFSVEKAKEAYSNICQKLDQILRLCAYEAKVSENVELYCSPQKNIIPKVGLSTQLTNLDFTIGLFRGFYITTEIKNFNNLGLMPDSFWSLFLKLSDIGKFDFKEGEQPTKDMRSKYPQLFNKKGSYYKIFRNYFLYQVEHKQIRSLGYITVSWPDDTRL